MKQKETASAVEEKSIIITLTDISTVVNLTGIALSNDETTLSRGLSFCTTPRHFDSNQLLDDLESYFRHLLLKEFFVEIDMDESNEKGRDAALEIYIKRVRNDVLYQIQKLHNVGTRDNLSPWSDGP